MNTELDKWAIAPYLGITTVQFAVAMMIVNATIEAEGARYWILYGTTVSIVTYAIFSAFITFEMATLIKGKFTFAVAIIASLVLACSTIISLIGMTSAFSGIERAMLEDRNPTRCLANWGSQKGGYALFIPAWAALDAIHACNLQKPFDIEYASEPNGEKHDQKPK